MLGSVKADIYWKWTVHGKHPVAKDYFTIGQDEDPFGKAFSEWLDRGNQEISSRKDLLSASCSWRFWASSPKKDHVACGIVRNSCDMVGRPFPLLIMGNGYLKDGETHWDLLPLFFERLWGQMEHMAAKSYQSMDQLKLDIRLLRTPLSNWQELSMFRDRIESEYAMLSRHSPEDAGVPRTIQGQDKVLGLNLVTQGGHDPLPLINHWHKKLRSTGNEKPTVVFMGGKIDHPQLVVFLRSLAQKDFALLWNSA